MGKERIMSLIGELHLTWKRYLEGPLLVEGITLKQYYLLRKLGEVGSLRPADIAELLYCDRPTASVVIGNMEKKGWIRRERSREDRRSWLLFMTPEGKVAREKYATLINREEINPADCLDREERKTLEKLLRKMKKHWENGNEQHP